MGIIIFLLIILIVCCYFLASEGIRQDQKRAAKQKAEQPKGTKVSQQRRNAIDDGQSVNLDVRNEYIERQQRQQTVSRPATEQRTEPEEEERQFVEARERRSSTPLSLNTGIKELDGPGMFHRLTSQGPNASAVYLLYSKQHNAYKVGYCKSTGIAGRVKQIRPEVPDIILDGTAVFTSSQNAFDAEQKILEKYKSYKYSGINGRWSGSTEWITKRPTGKPYFTKPSAVESKYEQELQAETERPIEADIYTVYLMNSPSKGMHKVSWCKTENITTKLRKAQCLFASDVKVVSRFPIQTRPKARAIAKKINEDAGTFRKEGRKETFQWTTNDSYLNQFKSWSSEGKQIG